MGKDMGKAGNEGLRRGADLASKASKPVADGLNNALKSITGECRLAIVNNFAFPIMVTFSAFGGGYPEPVRQLQDGETCESASMTCLGDLVQCAAWVSLDGKTWYFERK